MAAFSAPDDQDHDAPHLERLQKVLAAAGLGSRRQCEELITDGRVEVDGRVVNTLGAKVDPVQQEIRVDGEALRRPRLAYFIVHKPEGVVSTARDPSGRPRVTDMVPPEAGRLFPVGRLDMSSEGLILLTNDGELANHLMHPRYGVEKTYHVVVAGEPEQEVLEKLKRGVHLAEGLAKATSVKIRAQRKKSTTLEIMLNEGRNREIRRLLAKLGHKVLRLVRVGIGPLKLGDLPRGAYRPLTPEEVQKLRTAAFEAQGGQSGEKPKAPKRSRPPRKKAAAPKRPPRRAPGRPMIGGGGRTVIGESGPDVILGGDDAPPRSEPKTPQRPEERKRRASEGKKKKFTASGRPPKKKTGKKNSPGKGRRR